MGEEHIIKMIYIVRKKGPLRLGGPKTYKLKKTVLAQIILLPLIKENDLIT